ncbi:MAG: isoprenylcysteine carboxylmethyltransferase family protein [Gammaproteobacteria bacterium]|nr:MAG: isoprenylcysteine carboxylmethyltransferase family protein [Gammaproteobacteria bacterium]
MKTLRLVPPVYFVLALGLSLALHRWLPVAQLVVPPWRWAGLLLFAPVLALGVSAARAFSRRGTTLHPFGQPSALVVEGAYRYSRNPLYLGLALLLLATAIFLGSLTPFLVVPAFMGAVSSAFIRREERALEAAFGAQYRDYCQRVRRWL